MPSESRSKYSTALVLVAATVVLILASIPSSRMEIFSALGNSSREPFSEVVAAPSSELKFLRGELARRTWELIQTKEMLRQATEFREKFDSEKVPGCIPATVLLKRDGSPLRRSFVIDRGSKDGVKVGFPVAWGSQLIGRVCQIGENSSRVLHVADSQMRLSVVMVSRSGERLGFGICRGTGKTCELQMVEKNKTPWRDGDVLTSGFEGQYPQGLLVGTVSNPLASSDSEQGGEQARRESIGMFWDLRIASKDLDEIFTVLVLRHEKDPLETEQKQ